jgi:SAM-dependent methyltransferase
VDLFNCDFSGILYKIESSFTTAIEHATVYQAVETEYFNEILGVACAYRPSYDFFLDIGSGKGKACILAARSNKFKKIIGVEISESLIQTANQNAKKSNSHEIVFLHEDASNFRIPNGAALIFIYNPFDCSILEKFITLNYWQIKLTGSVIVYLNDIHRSVFEQNAFGTIYENKDNLISLWK